MSDFVTRLGDALVEAAERQAARPDGWRARLRWPRRGSTRVLVTVGALVLAGAGGTAGLLAGRGDVGGPPSLTFGRVSPQQQAAGIRALTRPLIFARGQLPGHGRQWQLVGFMTTRGFRIDVDWPREGQSGGCGTNVPEHGGTLDWQGQIPLGSGAEQGVIAGAVAPNAASVRLTWIHSVRRPALSRQAQIVRVTDPRMLAAMGLRRPFAYYLAQVAGPDFDMHATAYDAHGHALQRITVPDGISDTPGGSFSVPGRGCDPPNLDLLRPRLVSTLPPPAIRDRLAALRRPQRASDLLPLRLVKHGLFAALYATVETDAIRRLGPVPGGRSLYLIPATYRLPPQRPAGCLQTLSPRGRAQQARIRALEERASAGLHVTGLILGPDGDGGGGPSFDLARIRAGKPDYGTLGHLVVGLVPDGVADVDLRFAHGIARHLATPANYWATTVPTNAGQTRLEV